MNLHKGVSALEKRFKSVKRNSGFTLVELIVTLAVSAIVLSASAAGIIAWVHHADFVRNENYAETIYYAAQSELTRYRANGQLAELEEYVKKENLVVPVYDISDDYRATLVNDVELQEYNSKYDGRLYYLKKSAGGVDRDDKLGGLLAPYIYDGSIMEGAICVEFDPADGTVYSVTYSDRNISFTYDPDKEEGVSLRDRRKETREKNRVGYYSTDLSDPAPDAVGKTRLEKVQLINEEQLYLKWSMAEKYKMLRGFLDYTIEIYEKDESGDTLKYTFVVKGRDLKEAVSPVEADTSCVIECNGKKVTETGAGDDIVHKFIACQDTTGGMYLILDSIDYGADPEKIKAEGAAFDTSGFKNSASILQLFAEPEDIYIRIQAQGGPYKKSAWKRSNNSNTMFASMEEGTGAGGIATDTYTLENARHLYNIRYREKEYSLTAETENVTYKQNADIVWPGTTQRLYHSEADITEGMSIGSLKDDDKCPDGTGRPFFPAIPSLGRSSVLEVTGLRKYELKNFVLYQAQKGGEDKPLGIVAKNEGVIQGLTVTGIYAEGTKNVGAVCGINNGAGKLLNISVDGKVTGSENVGGIAGCDGSASVRAADEKKYEQLINYAEVSGSTAKIGGIIGSVRENTEVKLCENYGAVKATDALTACIGGIAGYNEGTVAGCVSAPQDKPITKTADGEKELDEDKLTGIFVGGLVGYNHGGEITESGTKKESSDGQEAYIIGRRFVGGIVGYNDSRLEASGDEVVLLASGRTNQAQVIGKDYVGGVMGANARLATVPGKEAISAYITAEAVNQDKLTEFREVLENCEAEEKYSSKMRAENWVNEGIIQATGKYAGGIAGYNAGELENCTTRINTSSAGVGSSLAAQSVLYGKNASYVGGVAGYNVGYIHNNAGNGADATIQVNSVVRGKNYIGGIVGYNGTALTAESGSDRNNSGKINNYALTGGYVSGECFVGGYVGLNTTEKIFDTVLLSKPNEVTADYFAGGVMGALILAPENTPEIGVKCASDNLFGEVEAKEAFAGGYAAYTRCLGVNVSAEEARGEAEELRNLLVSDESLQGKITAILNNGQTDPDGDVQLNFIFDEDDPGENRFASIKAPVFSGGIIGYNSWNTKLCLGNINNKAQVTATESISCPFISGRTEETFSFAGGIAGLVTPQMTVNNCRNSNGGDVTGAGTYSGGIAEVNLGTIMGCTVDSASGKNNYGGIAGLNTNEGLIWDCTLDGQISGEDGLGGIVMCNESKIEECTVQYSGSSGESAVVGTGSYIGGIAAVSRLKTKEDGTVYVNWVKSCTVNANIGTRNMGQYVGGLLGKYEGGTLVDSSTGSGVTIYGKEKIGGIAGQICADLSGADNGTASVINGADVEAASAAGGVCGELTAGADIAYCKNTGKVTSQQGLAGGVVPVVSAGGEGGSRSYSEIIQCENSGSVSSLRKKAGGIAAENSGRIAACITAYDGNGDAAAIEGVDAVGGIAGENWNILENCRLTGNVSVSNVDNGKSSMAVGGIVGRNNENGSVTGMSAGMAGTAKPHIGTKGSEHYAGGVAGINLGRISGGSIELNVELDTGKKGAAGGIAGANAQEVSNVTFAGNVTGTDGVFYGTGGIAGRNEFQDKAGTFKKAGTISGCTLSGGTIWAESNDSFSEGFNEKTQGIYLGGICGVNPEGGMIENCMLQGTVTVEGKNGFIGGITGYNLGELTGNNAGLKTAGAEKTIHIKNTKPEENKCVIGGIAGYNGEKGIVKNCGTGGECKVENINNDGNDEKHPTGGIIGCNQSARDQRGLINRATVNGWWVSGGIIGLQQTIGSPDFTIEECENYGNVTGGWRTAGGIISDWRSQSGTVRKCINKGEISVENGNDGLDSAGGIIGSGWKNLSVSIAIERCGNDGRVLSKHYAGGIAGAINSGPNYWTIKFTDCYNAGEIQNTGKDNNAGIFAGYVSKHNFNVTFTRCVNYGRGTDVNRSFYGIVSDVGDKEPVLNQCLNAGYNKDDSKAVSKVPMTGKNYFFTYSENAPADDGKGNICVAKFDTASGKFVAVNGARFDNNRLYLPGSTNEYIEFTEVEKAWTGSNGSGISISDLKGAFRTSDPNEKYALLRYGDDGIKKLNPPQSVEIVKTDDVYQINYEIDDATGAYTTSYYLKIYAGGGNTGTPLYSCEITDPTVSRWRIEGDEAQKLEDAIAAAGPPDSITAGMKAHTTLTREDGQPIEDSDETLSAPFELKKQLPAPEIHFEYKNGNNDRVAGEWILDNVDEYKKLTDAAGWRVTVAVGGHSLVINESSNGRKNFEADNLGQGLIEIRAQARLTTGDTYKASDEFAASAHLFKEQDTIQAEQNDANDYGEFIGTKAGNLKYELTLKQKQMSGNYNQYVNITYRADLMLNGNVIGTGTVFLPNNQGANSCTMDLSALSEDDIGKVIDCVNGKGPDTLKVRFYPWEIDDIIRYYTVEAGTEKSRVVEAGGSNFNNSLVEIDLCGKLAGKYAMHPAPILTAGGLTTEEKNGVITYTLHWDEESDIEAAGGDPDDYADAAYYVTVTGKTEDDADTDSGIVLYQGNIPAGRDREVPLTENNWKYNRLVLSVERTGGVSGSVTYIGASSEMDYPIPIRLDSVPKPGAKLRDRNNLIYEVNWLPSGEADWVNGYRIVMKGTKNGGTDPLPKEIYVDKADSSKTEIDLTAYPKFKDVKTVEFSVVTISNDPQNYLDSRESPGIICEVPERLSAPPEDELKLKLIKDTESDITDLIDSLAVADFKKLSLKQRDDTASTEDATYETEYFVTDSDKAPKDFGEDWRPAGGGTGWEEGSRPEQNGDNGIYISREPVRMTGNLREAAYQLSDIDADQAGRTIWFRTRAVSNNKISSLWTPWQHIKLPVAELETVQLREEQTTDNSWPYKVGGTPVGELKMRQPKLVFAPVDLAAGYQIAVKEADHEEPNPDVSGGDPITVVGETHIYMLEKNPDVTVGSIPLIVKEDTGTEIAPADPAGEAKDGVTIYSYELYDMPHTFEISNGSTTSTYVVEVKAKLRYSVKEGTVQEIWLELPEGQCLLNDNGDTFGEEFVTMAAADVTVLAPEETDGAGNPKEPRYVVKKLTRWQRTKKDDGTYETEISNPAVNTPFLAREAFFGGFLETMNAEDLGDGVLDMLGIDKTPEKLPIPEELPDAENGAAIVKPDDTKKETDEETDSKNNDVSGNDSGGRLAKRNG